MQHHLGTSVLHDAQHSSRITDITQVVGMHTTIKTKDGEQRRRRVGR